MWFFNICTNLKFNKTKIKTINCHPSKHDIKCIDYTIPNLYIYFVNLTTVILSVESDDCNQCIDNFFLNIFTGFFSIFWRLLHFAEHYLLRVSISGLH